MTVIEFFDKNAIDNMLSALCCQPERILFVGHNRTQIEKQLEKAVSKALDDIFKDWK